MNEIVSVIIPVYNLQKYISRCIESIINQTYSNIEIIIIDDGSKDNSYKICCNYYQNDNRIKLFKNPSKGVSSARNIGIRNAVGSYICFVDGDDYIEETMIENLVKWIKESKSDIAICGTKDIDENGKLIKTCLEKEIRIYSREEFLKGILIGHPFTCVSWGKIYKSEIVKKNLFDESIYIAEDLEWLNRMLSMLNRIYFNPMNLYNWTVRSTSSLHSMKLSDSQQEIEIVNGIMREYKDKKIIYNATIPRYIHCNLRSLKLATIEKNRTSSNLIKKAMKPYIIDYLKHNNVTFMLKVKLIAKVLLY